MKKRITIVLEVDTDDKQMLSDDFIKNDLEQEINCASNTYEIKSVETEVVNNMVEDIGLKPKYIDDIERIMDITDAMKRYSESNILIPVEWIDSLVFIVSSYLVER